MVKKQYFYSPYTGEMIKGSKKMDWYGATDIVPPEAKENESLIFKDGAWVTEKNDNSEQLEKDRINAINNKANEVIEAKYPLYKQLNIRGKLLKDEATNEHYNDTDIEVMDMFINAVLGIAKTAKADKIPVDEIDWDGLSPNNETEGEINGI